MAESSSAYGQHMHDDRTHNHYYMDVDGIIYKRDSKILRVIEHKKPGQSLKKSEIVVLRFISYALELLIKRRGLNLESGVFIVHSSPPWKDAEVTNYKTGIRFKLCGDALQQFETGMPVSGTRGITRIHPK